MVGYDWSGHIWNDGIQDIASVGIFEREWRYSGLLCLIVDALSSSRCRRPRFPINLHGESMPQFLALP